MIAAIAYMAVIALAVAVLAHDDRGEKRRRRHITGDGLDDR